jgi:hypothetical protein
MKAFPHATPTGRPMTAAFMKGGNYATSTNCDLISQSEMPIDLRLAAAK